MQRNVENMENHFAKLYSKQLNCSETVEEMLVELPSGKAVYLIETSCAIQYGRQLARHKSMTCSSKLCNAPW